ncbi:MAG: glycosyltransferase, partial [Candidatus Promineifilaceae bacterium]
PLILWNQRWEYDKNPDTFFAALDVLAREAIPFRVAICGQQFGRQPPAFESGINHLGERVHHAGFADPLTYARLLWESDVVVSTAHHEFFGIGILEAIYANSFPVLPARLSYPELIPVEYHETCLYDDFQGLVNILRMALLNNDESRRAAAALSAAMARYDWSNIAPLYDAQVETLIA